MCGQRWTLVGYCVLSLATAVRAADEPAGRGADEQAIRAAAKAYLTALDKGDVKALGEIWTSDGDFVDEFGRSFPAQDLIAAEAASGDRKSPTERKLSATTIRFLGSSVAIEDGAVDAEGAPDEPPKTLGRFTAIWVKQNGRWRLASLRESRTEPPADEGRLEDLDWMTGDWSGEHNGFSMEVSSRWNANHTFLLRDLKIVRDGETVFSGVQRIGWDPIARRIKSWTFDSNGGYGDGQWSKQGDTWVVQASGVLPDGRTTTSTNFYHRDSADGCTWKSVDLRAGEKAGAALNIQLFRKNDVK